MPDLKKYIGRKYEEYNCLDLVKEFYLDQFGLKLSNYYEGPTPSREEVSTLIQAHRGEFLEIKFLESKDPNKYLIFGDLVLIKLYGIECHIGVYIDKGLFLHSVRGTGSCIERLEKYQKLLSGFYRHGETAA